MITKIEAKKIAEKKIKEIEEKSKIKLVILDEHTIEFEFGWVFFYQSEEYVRTGNYLYMLGGNAPMIVDKYTGNLIETGTGKDAELYIVQYCIHRDNLDTFHDVIR